MLQLLGNAAPPGNLVQAETLVIAEHARRQAPAEQYGSLRLTRRVEQGDSALSFYCPAPRQ